MNESDKRNRIQQIRARAAEYRQQGLEDQARQQAKLADELQRRLDEPAQSDSDRVEYLGTLTETQRRQITEELVILGKIRREEEAQKTMTVAAAMYELERYEEVATRTERQTLPPWEQIPDHGWDRIAVELLWTGYSDPYIAVRVGGGIASKTVTNRLSMLRQQYPELVPRRDRLRQMKNGT